MLMGAFKNCTFLFLIFVEILHTFIFNLTQDNNCFPLHYDIDYSDIILPQNSYLPQRRP